MVYRLARGSGDYQDKLLVTAVRDIECNHMGSRIGEDHKALLS